MGYLASLNPGEGVVHGHTHEKKQKEAPNKPPTPSLHAVESSRNGFLALVIVILLVISKNQSRARLR